MAVGLPLIVEDLAARDRARLGLGFEADCAVLDPFDAAAEARLAIQEVCGVYLHALLIGIGVHGQSIARKRCNQGKRFAEYIKNRRRRLSLKQALQSVLQTLHLVI